MKFFLFCFYLLIFNIIKCYVLWEVTCRNIKMVTLSICLSLILHVYMDSTNWLQIYQALLGMLPNPHFPWQGHEKWKKVYDFMSNSYTYQLYLWSKKFKYFSRKFHGLSTFPINEESFLQIYLIFIKSVTHFSNEKHGSISMKEYLIIR